MAQTNINIEWALSLFWLFFNQIASFIVSAIFSFLNYFSGWKESNPGSMAILFGIILVVVIGLAIKKSISNLLEMISKWWPVILASLVIIIATLAWNADHILWANKTLQGMLWAYEHPTVAATNAAGAMVEYGKQEATNWWDSLWPW